ncbi:glycosyltransferase family 2 protein [Leuconostoc mesenteroides]|uniref:glycosyltransferase family 2 protein n=1 Tax=Leuconostoc mesenteroides TaxID=1245 RepID=UPI003CE90264
MPVYNVESYVKNSIQSVLNQTFKDLELIIINDGSTDNSLDVCKSATKNDSRARIISQSNKGLSAARNTGLSAARGTYIYFFDSDDLLNLCLIDTVINHFYCSNDIDAVVFGNTTFETTGIPLNHTPIPFDVPTKITAKDGLKLIMQKKLPITSWSFVIKRKIFSQNSILFPVGKLYEDVFTTGKIYNLCNSILVLPLADENPWYWYRIRKNSIMFATETNWSEKNAFDYFQAYTSFFNLTLGVVSDKVRNEWLLNNYLYVTINSYSSLSKKEWKEVVTVIDSSPINTLRFSNFKLKLKKTILTSRWKIYTLKKIMRFLKKNE